MPPERDMAGKTAIVTGANSGIGKAVALALARRRMALQGTRTVSVAVRDLSAGRSLRAAVRANVAPALRKTAPPVKLFSRSFAEHFFFHTQGSSFPLSALCDFLLTGRSACARTCG